jgi:tRNA pseudouridine55 synthase
VSGAPAGAGLVVVDKPAGLTSHDVVARVRRLARTRKVGHAGTLDPMATGVLLLGVGRATRLLGHLALTDKAYDATIRLGASTVTDDAEGDVVEVAPPERVAAVDEESVRAALTGFVGEVDQVPSAVSAVKVDGERAYRRVRAGEDVVLPARRVRIDGLEVRSVRRGPSSEGEPGGLLVEVSVRCSSGTYVRAIARDLGAVLEVGGHLTALRRTAVGGVGLAEATPLAALEEAGEVPLLPMAHAAARFFPTVVVDAGAARDVGHGRALEVDLDGPRPTAVLGPDGDFLALYRPSDQAGRAVPVAVFG